MTNVIITKEELELIVDYLDEYSCVIKGEGLHGDTNSLDKLIKSLEVALNKNIEYVD